MQVDSIISNTISQDIRQKGHQSIRFAPDGFSVLVSDASYKPVFLKKYTYDESVPAALHPAECGRVLEDADLLNFEGETVLILDNLAVTLVPKQYYNESSGRELLEKTSFLDDTDSVHHRYLKDRRMNLVYAVPREVEVLKERFTGTVVILSPSECLVSLSDQVQASDHQRGFLLAEVQPFTLDLLVIQEDQIRLLNRYSLRDPSEFIYYSLNTMKQLGIDREAIPIYLSGIVHEDHELFGLLGKYVRKVITTPYYLEELSRVQILHYIILSEGSKCA